MTSLFFEYRCLNLRCLDSMIQQRSTRSSNGERGYILLTLLLIVSLMIIMAAVIVPTITFEIRRDKEEELIHRGVQYSRAIRAYYKKFGSYPARIEQLESTNNLRFLRKRYKDPITGKDFKLLHYGEVQLSFGGGVIPGATPVSALSQATNGGPGANGSAFGQPSTFGGNSAFGQSSGQSAFGGNSGFGQSSTFGNNTNSASGQNQQQPNNQDAGTDASQPQANGDQSGAATPPTVYGANGGSGQEPAGQQVQALGGGGVVGVASISKKDTIREFNHKHKYNEWQFIYDPGTDRGGLLMTPNQPALLPQAAPLNGQNGTNGANGSFGNAIGTQPFGGQNGFQNSPQNPPAQPVAPAAPSDPNNPPQQQ
jgi:type II secretory pathway pseudopilin PulG